MSWLGIGNAHANVSVYVYYSVVTVKRHTYTHIHTYTAVNPLVLLTKFCACYFSCLDLIKTIIGTASGGGGGAVLIAVLATTIFLLQRRRRLQRQREARQRQRFEHRVSVNFDQFFERPPAGQAPQYELPYSVLTEYSVVEEPLYCEPDYMAMATVPSIK